MNIGFKLKDYFIFKQTKGLQQTTETVVNTYYLKTACLTQKHGDLMVGVLDFGLRGMGQAIVLCSWATQYPSPLRSINGSQ